MRYFFRHRIVNFTINFFCFDALRPIFGGIIFAVWRTVQYSEMLPLIQVVESYTFFVCKQTETIIVVRECSRVRSPSACTAQHFSSRPKHRPPAQTNLTDGVFFSQALTEIKTWCTGWRRDQMGHAPQVNLSLFYLYLLCISIVLFVHVPYLVTMRWHGYGDDKRAGMISE